MTSLAARLADFYAGLNSVHLLPATVHAVRRHVLDTLGAALAGAQQPEPTAALVNGAASHALELDDASGCDHSDAVIVPAMLAALSVRPEASQADLLAAVVTGYDLDRRVMEAADGYDAHNGAGWHSTGTCGVFAAAIAVARLWRLSPGDTAQALGIAGSLASGNWSMRR